ncbi:MAG: acyl-CoA thioesterase [Planctomycetales bacterium]|nr:acyl-CoA thioesterase [Planctomycetales bacterium]MCA9169724.1 acyl-CoA thioesterase [Planctomycetales bacterium]
MAFVYEQRVEFRDTDAAGIAHFSVFFTWMEEAEHAALRSLGLSVMPRQGRDPGGAESAIPQVTWPRVSAQCDYVRPLRFEDDVQVTVTLGKVGSKSLTYQFQFSRGEESIANGQVTVVCCSFVNGHLKSTEIPAEIAARLQTLVA